MAEKKKKKMEAAQEPDEVCKAKKSEEEGEEEKEGGEKELEKGEFEKSLEALEKLTKTGRFGRRSELLKKAMEMQTSDEENAELAKLLAGGEGGVAEEVAKSMDSEEEFSKSMDVSPYLNAFHKSMTDSLTTVATALEKSEAKQEEQAMVLAKALLDVAKLSQLNAKLIKSLGSQLESFGRQPARPPKGMVSAAQNTPAPTNGVQMSKAQVLDSLSELFEKSMSGGKNGLAEDGTQLDMAIATYEQTNEISPALLKAAAQHWRSKNGRAA